MTVPGAAEIAFFKLHQARSYRFHNLPTTRLLQISAGQILKVVDPRDIRFFRAKTDVVVECDEQGVPLNAPPPGMITASPTAKSSRKWNRPGAPQSTAPAPVAVQQGAVSRYAPAHPAVPMPIQGPAPMPGPPQVLPIGGLRQAVVPPGPAPVVSHPGGQPIVAAPPPAPAPVHAPILSPQAPQVGGEPVPMPVEATGAPPASVQVPEHHIARPIPPEGLPVPPAVISPGLAGAVAPPGTVPVGNPSTSAGLAAIQAAVHAGQREAPTGEEGQKALENAGLAAPASESPIEAVGDDGKVTGDF